MIKRFFTAILYTHNEQKNFFFNFLHIQIGPHHNSVWNRPKNKKKTPYSTWVFRGNDLSSMKNIKIKKVIKVSSKMSKFYIIFCPQMEPRAH